MLTVHAERYIALRRALGFKLHASLTNLRAFARYATDRGDTHVRAVTALDWATEGCSPYTRYARLRDVVHLARFLQAEDPAHEIPSNPFQVHSFRPLPYIYSNAEVAQLTSAVSLLRPSYPLRRKVYATLLGLIAATGLRISEALNLEFQDVLPGGILHIHHTKCGKSRMVPLHPSAAQALEAYLEVRRQAVVADNHIFLSAGGRRISSSMVEYTFHRILRLARIAPDRSRRPRLHDLRHTFATRALEQCSAERESIGRHFVALSTYLGHTDIAYTYWYLEATPELMSGMAVAAEAVLFKEGA